jgi:hypothetical protein
MSKTEKAVIRLTAQNLRNLADAVERRDFRDMRELVPILREHAVNLDRAVEEI